VKSIFLPVLFVLHTLAAAAVLQPGAALPLANLKDQHDKPLAIERGTKLVFFASEMGGSRLMTKALDGLPPTALRNKNAVYVADISGMPAIFTTIVALPRLQKMPYPVALIRDAKEAESLPRKPGTVTVLKVDAGRISTIEFVSDLQQIKGHLK
jgi:NADPH-dependent ferric siderophore reductase